MEQTPTTSYAPDDSMGSKSLCRQTMCVLIVGANAKCTIKSTMEKCAGMIGVKCTNKAMSKHQQKSDDEVKYSTHIIFCTSCTCGWVSRCYLASYD